jgi:hypothetical protein
MMKKKHSESMNQHDLYGSNFSRALKEEHPIQSERSYNDSKFFKNKMLRQNSTGPVAQGLRNRTNGGQTMSLKSRSKSPIYIANKHEYVKTEPNDNFEKDQVEINQFANSGVIDTPSSIDKSPELKESARSPRQGVKHSEVT